MVWPGYVLQRGRNVLIAYVWSVAKSRPTQPTRPEETLVGQWPVSCSPACWKAGLAHLAARTIAGTWAGWCSWRSRLYRRREPDTSCSRCRSERRPAASLAISARSIPVTPRSRQRLMLLDRLGRGGGGPQRRLLGRRLPLAGGRFANPGAGPRVLGGLWRGACYLAERAKSPDVVGVPLSRDTSTCACSVRSRGSAVFPRCLTSSSRCYDTAIVDCGLRSRVPPSCSRTVCARRARLPEASPRMVVVDTPEHADSFARFTDRARKHFAVLWVRSAFEAAPDPATTRAFSGISRISPCTASRPWRRRPRCSPATAAASA